VSYGLHKDYFKTTWTDSEIAEIVTQAIDLGPHRVAVKPPAVASVTILRLWEKTMGHCAYCWEPLAGYEIDHVVPRFMGGCDRMINKVLCCYACNVKKGGGLPRGLS
jgi:5-methylcytosine-specific restriction endonuclease McrA